MLWYDMMWCYLSDGDTEGTIEGHVDAPHRGTMTRQQQHLLEPNERDSEGTVMMMNDGGGGGDGNDDDNDIDQNIDLTK